jgi:hypothetical protein
MGHSDDPRGVAAAGDAFVVHHFGSVRRPARLRQKWRMQAKQHNTQKPRWDRVPGFVFDMFPHKWDDPDCLPDLAIYGGPQMQIVHDQPEEFVRDGFMVYERLRRRGDGRIDEAGLR